MTKPNTGTIFYPNNPAYIQVGDQVAQSLVATGDIEADTLGRVPYSGARADVNLGSFSIFAANIGESGEGDPI